MNSQEGPSTTPPQEGMGVMTNGNKIVDVSSQFRKIAEVAVLHSGGRLRLAFKESDSDESVNKHAGHFLKLDEKRFGWDIDFYCTDAFFSGSEVTLELFLREVIYPLRGVLPESYAKSCEALCTLGESVYTEDMLPKWRARFR